MAERAGLVIAEMDALADAAREQRQHIIVEDFQIDFRRLQKARHPDLTEAQWLDLFEAWQAHYRARAEAELEATRAQMVKLAAQAVQLKPPAAPFVCVCGATTNDPLDPEFARIHQPHFFVAGLDKITSTKIAGRRIDVDGYSPDR